VSDHTHDGPPARRHYQLGCRHPECRQANTEYGRVYREATQPAFYGEPGYDISDIIDDLALLMGSTS
jgi:hypothetical protein